MDEFVCKACGKCCNKHWLVKLTNRHEILLFKDSLISGEYIFTVSSNTTFHLRMKLLRQNLFLFFFLPPSLKKY